MWTTAGIAGMFEEYVGYNHIENVDSVESHAETTHTVKDSERAPVVASTRITEAGLHTSVTGLNRNSCAPITLTQTRRVTTTLIDTVIVHTTQTSVMKWDTTVAQVDK